MDSAHREQLNRILANRKNRGVSVGGVPLEEPSSATAPSPMPAAATTAAPTVPAAYGGGYNGASPNPQKPQPQQQFYQEQQPMQVAPPAQVQQQQQPAAQVQQPQHHTMSAASPLAPPGVKSSFEGQQQQQAINTTNSNVPNSSSSNTALPPPAAGGSSVIKAPSNRPPVAPAAGGATTTTTTTQQQQQPSSFYDSRGILQSSQPTFSNNPGNGGPSSASGQFQPPTPHNPNSGVAAQDSGYFGPTMASQATFSAGHPCGGYQQGGRSGSQQAYQPSPSPAPTNFGQPPLSRRSSSSTVQLNNNYDPNAPSKTGYTQPGTEDLFRRGTFTNFRDRPLLMSPNIRSYRKDGDQGSVQRTRSLAGGGTAQSAAHAQTLNSVKPGSVVTMQGTIGGARPGSTHEQHLKKVQKEVQRKPTEKNPFRQQEFQDFSVAPNYEAPLDIQEALEHHQVMMRGTEGSVAHALKHDKDEKEEIARNGGQPPVFDLQQCIAALSTGDWFLKWTRRKDKVHRRYFWLDVERSVLYWGKTPDAFSYLSSSIRIEDIVQIESQCVVDDGSGKTLYLLMISTTQRVVQMGTEQRDKFDVWFDTLQRLSDSVREYNARYYARYASNDKNAGQQQKMARAQQISSAD